MHSGTSYFGSLWLGSQNWKKTECNNDHHEGRGDHAVFVEVYVIGCTNRARCGTYNPASSRPERQSSLGKHTVRFLSRKHYAESGQLQSRATGIRTHFS